MDLTKSDLKHLYHDKQIEVLEFALSTDFFMLINSGAKRSGKTVINNDLFLLELQHVQKIAKQNGIREPKYILAGANQASVKRNILDELTQKYGISFKLDKSNSFKIFGVRVYCFGHSKSNDIEGIRGMTAHGAYVNEATLANKFVFDEIVSRCSGEGARLLVDTNPDAPNHWLMENYIKKADGVSRKAFNFSLHDNTKLNERYIREVENSTPSGMLYDRYIKGMWTTAAGVVYQDFNSKKHIITRKMYDEIVAPNIVRYFAGVDWGYEHYGSIVVFAETSNKNVYLVEEVARRHQEIDYWTDVAKDIKARYGNITFWADSARPEHVERFKRERLKCINADKAVLSGIEQVGKMIKQDRFFYVKPADKKEYEKSRFKDEIFTYAWDEKHNTGAPVKVNDDTMDSIRYAIYNHYKRDILRGRDTEERRKRRA